MFRPRDSRESDPRLRRRRIGLLALIGLAVLLLAAQLAATPLARWRTRISLQQLQGYVGTFEDVHASLFPPAYSIDGLRIDQRMPSGRMEPFFAVERVEMTLAWRKLLHGHVVAAVTAQTPSLEIVQTTRRDESAASAEAKAKKLPDLGEQLRRMAPLKVDEMIVRDGQVRAVDLTREPAPRLAMTDVDAVMKNLATRAVLSEGEPTTINGTATLQRSGALSARIAADPFSKTLNFEGSFRLEHLKAEDLHGLIAGTTELRPTKGSIELFAEFKAEGGKLSGGVKPILHNLEVKADEAGVMPKLKEWLADAGLELFSNESKGGDETVATVIPIKGSVRDPEAQLWPTVIGVMRNAFVEGLSAGFKGVPPKTADEKEGPLEQAGEALKKKGGEPEAQPEK